MAIEVSLTDFPLWEKAKKNRTLLRLTLELTNRCNNNCIHCYNNLPENDTHAIKNELSTDEIKKIIDQAVDLGLLWILLTGGEILVRKDFFDLYFYMKKKGLLISLFTNATLITKEYAKILKKYPPRDIEVSVYGVSKKTHSKVTRTDSFSKFKSGIDILREASIPFSLKTTVLRANYKYLKDITEFCNHNSNKQHQTFRFDPFLMLRADKNELRNKEILKQRLSVNEIIEIEKQNIDRVEAMKKQCAAIDEKSPANDLSEIIFKCGAGMNSCSIDCYGNFKLCSSLVSKNCIYNLRKGSLKDAWENFVPGIHTMTSKKKSYHDNCSNCKLRNFCRWCPAIGDIETGELDEKVDYFCTVAHKRYEFCINSKTEGLTN